MAYLTLSRNIFVVVLLTVLMMVLVRCEDTSTEVTESEETTPAGNVSPTRPSSTSSGTSTPPPLVHNALNASKEMENNKGGKSNGARFEVKFAFGLFITCLSVLASF